MKLEMTQILSDEDNKRIAQIVKDFTRNPQPPCTPVVHLDLEVVYDYEPQDGGGKTCWIGSLVTNISIENLM